jgi:hypothetical protein
MSRAEATEATIGSRGSGGEHAKMPPARGDQRPCTATGCTGTMRFGRESGNDAGRIAGAPPPAAGAAHDTKGWICSKDAKHFRKGD